MVKSKTIVLWGREDLLSSSVELFLTNQKGWEVISISNEESFNALLEAVDKMHPDVVIIHQGDCSVNSSLPMQLIQDYPGLKVITLSLQDNLMEVYSKQKILVKAASDLISVVESASIVVNQQLE